MSLYLKKIPITVMLEVHWTKNGSKLDSKLPKLRNLMSSLDPRLWKSSKTEYQLSSLPKLTKMKKTG